MSACSFVRAPVWKLFIITKYNRDIRYHSGALAVYSYILPAAMLYVTLWPMWENELLVMLHMQKPEEFPVYTIWRVWIHSAFNMFRAFIEVFF